MADGRVANWQESLRSVADFWRVGAGLGTYQDIYLLYQNRFSPVWFYHAENQFLQALVEGGVPALLALLAQIGWLGYLAVWLSRRGGVDYAFGIGGLTCLVGQVVAGSFDFGLYHPANFLLMSAVCGSLAVVRPLVNCSGRRDIRASSTLGFRLPRCSAPCCSWASVGRAASAW